MWEKDVKRIVLWKGELDMSKRTYLGEELEIEKVVISDEEGCEYNLDRKCSNNYNGRWLGKVCHFGCSEECEYYEKESGKTEWRE